MAACAGAQTPQAPSPAPDSTVVSPSAQALSVGAAPAPAANLGTRAAPEPGAPPSPAAPGLRISSSLAVPVGGEQAADLPVYFEADNLEGTPGVRTRATGDVRLTRGDLTMLADEVVHTGADNTAQASGHVQILRRGDIYTGPQLTLQLDTLQGEFLNPTYRFARTGAGGTATRVQFLGSSRLRATDATYSSCTPDNTGDLDWVLSTSDVQMDFDANEGRAKNAVIRFMGVPLLAAPVLTFPLTEERKSGFLPPSFDINNKSGFEFSQPYYWNIAPNRDATITPTLSTRRGVGAAGEFRYLYPSDQGSLQAVVLPEDRVAGRSRSLVNLNHLGDLNQPGATTLTNYELRWRRVSDDDYWKDFPRDLPTLTPRLFDSHAAIERQISTRAWGLGPSTTALYARVQTWQALQDLSPDAPESARIIAPYRREPQLGLRSRSVSETGWLWRFQTEFNRFTHEDDTRVSGNRVHALARLERPFGGSGSGSGWNLTPRVSLNAASYDLDPRGTTLRTSATRITPTFSLDGGLVFERPLQWFGRTLTQTLEPRALYVYTPYRRQSDLPLFDSAPRDFNQYSIFSENAFTGVDRVSDANQLTLGLTTRVFDANGAETLRLGIVQKVLFTEQRITPDDGPPDTQRLSDLLLLGATSIIPHWWLDSTVQYGAREGRVRRSLLGARYSPGPWRTISANYRYSRESSEQVDVGWQWPIAGQPRSNDSPLAALRAQMAAERGAAQSAPTAAPSCGGTWYSVGRLNYSLKDKRLSDALLGFEYDGGCWIARVVAERLSIGRAEASTRLMFQLELVGLSRLGTSPLTTLKNNIPGYRLLREENALLPGASNSGAATAMP